jgi:sporulation protein YlmC with PRC-barrel domain
MRLHRIDFPSASRDRPRTRRVLGRLIGAAPMLAALLAIVAGPKAAQAQPVHLVKVDLEVVAAGYRVSDLIGREVINEKDETVGDIDDLIVDKEQVMFAVLEVGGFLGVGGYLVVVPYDSLEIGSGETIKPTGASKESLEALEEFEYPEK